MSENKSLMQLVDMAAEIEQALIASSGEITEEMEELIPILNDKLPDKVDNYALLIDRLEYNAKYYSAKAQEFMKMASACEKFSEKLLGNVHWTMCKFHLDELKGNDYKYKMMKSESVALINESLIPTEFHNVKTTVSFDKKSLKEAIKAGREIPGAALQVNTRAQRFTNKPK